MGLLGDFTAYIDSLKRGVKNTLSDTISDPSGMLSRRLSQVSESLPEWVISGGSVMPQGGGELLPRPSPQEWGTNVAMNAPTMGLLGHTVYHGSPHKFDKFDASKIGTGEGAQAYGHGLYLADAPDVARSYISAGGARPTATPEAYAADIVGQMGGEKKALQHLRDILPPAGETTFSGDSRDLIAGAIKAVESGAYRQRAGSLYKVDLPDEWLPKMLDWDKPLSEQPEAVRRALSAAGIAQEKMPLIAIEPRGDRFQLIVDNKISGIFDSKAQADAAAAAVGKRWYPTDRVKTSYGGNPDAGALYNNLAASIEGWDQKAGATEILKKAGIPGIRYLDQGSRGKEGGTYNYVVFPGMEHLLKILERE